MERWQKSLRDALTDVGAVARRFGLDEVKLREVAEAFRFRVSKYYYSLIREKGDAIYRQCFPDPAESEEIADFMVDRLS